MSFNTGVIAGFILGSLCYTCFSLIVRAVEALCERARAWRASQSRRQKGLKNYEDGQLTAAKIDAVAEAARAAAMPSDGWYPLPGGTRLEYKATGFEIELRPQQARAPYVLVTPEGFELAAGHLLQALKLTGAWAAGERAQFAPREGGAA